MADAEELATKPTKTDSTQDLAKPKKKKDTSEKKKKQHKKKTEETKRGEDELDLGPPPEDEFDQREIDVLKMMHKWKKEGKTNYMPTIVFLNNISDLNSQEQTVFIEISIQMWFQDDRLIGKKDGEVPAADLWNPGIEVLGSIDVEEMVEDGKGSYYVADRWSEVGIGAFYQKFKGTVRVPLNLREFPFDRQLIKIRFASKFYGEYTLHFHNITDKEQREDFSAAVHMNEFQLVRPAEVHEVLEMNLEDKRIASYLEVWIPLRRLSGYYLMNIISPLVVLSMMYGHVRPRAMYIVPPYVLNDRLQISITLFLSQVAFSFVVNETIPKISHGTYLTKYFILCYVLLGIGAIENVVSYLVNRYHCALGDAQEACWTALQLDLGVMGSVASISIVATIVYVYLGTRKLQGEIDMTPPPPPPGHVKTD